MPNICSIYLFSLYAGVKFNLVIRLEQTYELPGPVSIIIQISCPLTTPLIMACNVAPVETVVLKPFSFESLPFTYGILLWILPHMDVWCFSPHFKQPIDRHDTALCDWNKACCFLNVLDGLQELKLLYNHWFDVLCSDNRQSFYLSGILFPWVTCPFSAEIAG